MISKLFDQTNKGKKVNSLRTICEVHREIYDLLIIHLQNNPKALVLIVPKLEEVYLMGIKMNLKMIERKCEVKDWAQHHTQKEAAALRKERIRLVGILNFAATINK